MMCELHEGIGMKWFLMFLIVSLLLTSAPVSARETHYVLTVSVHESVRNSLTRMRDVLTELDATLSTDAALGYIIANLGSQGGHVTVPEDGDSIERTTLQLTKLIVMCRVNDGDAEVLCREIQRRYESQ